MTPAQNDNARGELAQIATRGALEAARSGNLTALNQLLDAACR